MSILVTGGTGYIGSHTVVELLNQGYDCVIVDNLSNSKICVLDRIQEITGIRPKFVCCDLLDNDALKEVFDEYPEIDTLNDNAKYFFFQKALNSDVSCVPSHQVIEKYIREKGMDYRFEVAEHPVPELRNRKIDNTSIARCKNDVCVG